MTTSHPAHSVSEITRSFLSTPRQMLINGQWIAAEDGSTLAAINPATGQTIGSIPNGSKTDVDKAVGAARAALESGPWSAFRPSQRERVLLRLADLIEADADVLSELECLDNGKTLVMARRVDIRGTVDFLRYIAGWATKIEGSTIDVSFPRPKKGQYFAYTRREPVGVVGAIIPWNFPLMMAAWKIGPALATGCTLVLKPAEETSLSALRLGELIAQAGIPDGVVNIVTGEGRIAGAALANHPGIDKVAFTGSTEVGKLIGAAAVNNMTRMSLELGGKSPVIVLEDADIASVVRGAASAIFFNHGQVCTAGSRLYVHSSIFDQVVAGIVDEAARIKLGDGMDPASHMGPLVSQRQRDRVASYIESGIAAGARRLTGETTADLPGYFVSPTVMADTTPSMRIVSEEIFGPVVVAMPFNDIDDVVRSANDSPYGLGASIWSNNLSKTNHLISRLKAGTVWVNCHNLIDPALPFGGFKQSGIGREMGSSVIDMYTETKSVCVLSA